MSLLLTVLSARGGSVTPADPDDETLLARFKGGDAAAFELLLQRYERPIYNFLLRSLRDRDVATDLTQEVFLRVVRRSEQFRGNSKFSTWLYTIARNLCIDHGRKMVFRRHRSLDAPAHPKPDAAPLVDRLAGGEPGADRRAIAQSLQAEIARAVEALPPDQREVFLLRQLQGMPFKAIAEVVGASENTVKSRMRYALERLQEALAEYRDYVGELT